MFGSQYGFYTQEEENGENSYTGEKDQDDVDIVYQYFIDTNSECYVNREVERGQSGSRHSAVDGFQTEGGIAILHFSLDSFDISMAPGTFFNTDKPKEMDNYEPGIYYIIDCKIVLVNSNI